MNFNINGGAKESQDDGDKNWTEESDSAYFSKDKERVENCQSNARSDYFLSILLKNVFTCLVDIAPTNIPFICKNSEVEWIIDKLGGIKIK